MLRLPLSFLSPIPLLCYRRNKRPSLPCQWWACDISCTASSRAALSPSRLFLRSSHTAQSWSSMSTVLTESSHTQGTWRYKQLRRHFCISILDACAHAYTICIYRLWIRASHWSSSPSLLGSDPHDPPVSASQGLRPQLWSSVTVF